MNLLIYQQGAWRLEGLRSSAQITHPDEGSKVIWTHTFWFSILGSSHITSLALWDVSLPEGKGRHCALGSRQMTYKEVSVIVWVPKTGCDFGRIFTSLYLCFLLCGNLCSVKICLLTPLEWLRTCPPSSNTHMIQTQLKIAYCMTTGTLAAARPQYTGTTMSPQWAQELSTHSSLCLEGHVSTRYPWYVQAELMSRRSRK